MKTIKNIIIGLFACIGLVSVCLCIGYFLAIKQKPSTSNPSNTSVPSPTNVYQEETDQGQGQDQGNPTDPTSEPTPTFPPTPTVPPTETPIPTNEPIESLTPTSTPTPKATNTPVPTNTPTPSPSPEEYTYRILNEVKLVDGTLDIYSDASGNGSLVSTVDLSYIIYVTKQCNETGWYGITANLIDGRIMAIIDIKEGFIHPDAYKTLVDYGTQSSDSSDEDKATYTFTDLSIKMVPIGKVNVRDLPSSEGNKLDTIPDNKVVMVTGKCNETGWYRIEYYSTNLEAPVYGYVEPNSLMEKPEATATPTPTPTPTPKPSSTPKPTSTPKPSSSVEYAPEGEVFTNTIIVNTSGGPGGIDEKMELDVYGTMKVYGNIIYENLPNDFYFSLPIEYANILTDRQKGEIQDIYEKMYDNVQGTSGSEKSFYLNFTDGKSHKTTGEGPKLNDGTGPGYVYVTQAPTPTPMPKTVVNGVQGTSLKGFFIPDGLEDNTGEFYKMSSEEEYKAWCQVYDDGCGYIKKDEIYFYPAGWNGEPPEPINANEPPTLSELTGSESEYFTYKISRGEVEITGFYFELANKNGVTKITVPDKLEGYPVTTIDDGVFMGADKLESIELPKGLKVIGADVFKNCTSLKSITIPDSVTSIGQGAFRYCTSLKSITIPDSVTGIGRWAFLDCTSLKSITIPNSVIWLGEKLFGGCTNLENVVLPEKIEGIEGSLFADCTSLKSITIPKSVTSIGGGAFENCTSLESLTLPDAVTTIGVDAFMYCAKLKKINIPDKVTSIGRQAFSGCASLESIVLPEGITSIEYGLFNGCTNLESIKLPDGITEIDQNAFYKCESLKSIEIPDGVTEITINSFYGCTNLESVTLPEGITTINPYSFEKCVNLKSINIPESVKVIGSSVFYDSKDIVITVIPGSYGETYAKNKKLNYNYK